MTPGTRVRTRRDLLGVSLADDNPRTWQIPAGTVGEVAGPWQTEHGHPLNMVDRIVVDSTDGPLSLPIGRDDVEVLDDDEVASG